MNAPAGTGEALADALDAGLASLPLALDAKARAALIAYVELLAKWNRTYNLTAIRDPDRMITHHLLDSLAAIPALDALAAGRAGVSVLDVGSGAGLPGIPFAVARPGWSVTLLEPVQKKHAFITQAVATLGLRNASPVAQRVEDYRPTTPFTLAVSRAFSDLASFAESTSRHVAADGALVAMKGVHPDEELRELPAAFAVSDAIALRVPGVDASRHLIVMRPARADAPTCR